ncbi:MAG: hypothetical protein IIV91_03080 [Alistipes sp.]|nr:hypothetical protein [Alistipes sp.]
MFETRYLKPKGGVAHVALHAADAVGSLAVEDDGCRVRFTDVPLEVSLADECSLFEEQLSTDGGVVEVCHRLTLVADRNFAQPWLDDDFLNRATCEGLVAEVTLCDSRRLLVGYSLRLASEQPLRLRSLIAGSGVRANDTPTLTLSLESIDAEMAMPIAY